jgi:hypothetical protein
MPTPTASGDALSGAADATDPAAGEVVATGEILDCKNSDIAVVASAEKDSYKVGANPVLKMTIQNISDVACKRDVGPKANSLEITSGGYHVWSSDDCNASNKSKVVTLKAGDKFASSITWNGRLTQKGCPNGEGDEAKAGSYDLVGRNGKVVIGGDGQVSQGHTVMKGNARKVRRLYRDQVLAGFAGGTADAFTLFERFEAKLEKHQGHLVRSAIELTRDWRTDRVLRRLEAMLAVANALTELKEPRPVLRRDPIPAPHVNHGHAGPGGHVDEPRH